MAMKFIIGVAAGALAMWAYQAGKLQGIMGNAPEPMQQAFSSFQNTVQNSTSGGQGEGTIARPTPAEEAGRPSEPLPS
jgi:hypothetical protein